MHRRLGLLLGAALAALLLSAAAGASVNFARNSAATATPKTTETAFERAWAAVPKSQKAREAKKVVVFGAEQDIDGFNTSLNCCSEYWAVVMGNSPVLRGAYTITNTGAYIHDLATKVVATPRSLTYVLRKNAKWNDGRHVTAADFIYTWKQFINPNNDVATRAGYDDITGATTKGPYQVTFHLKAPFADYKDLFGLIYPSVELAGQDFNKIWANCVCGKNGKPISDGPFILQSYTKGQGAVLVKNNTWYGKKASLNEILFKIITDTNTEIQAMRGGEVDAIAPSPQTALSQLLHQSGIVYSAIPALYQEHLDLQFGPHGVPIMKMPAFRKAIMLGINRQAIVNSLFGSYAPGLKLLNNLIFFNTDKLNYRPDFAKWNYNPKKAIAMLKAAGCTGGPSTPSASNNAYWTCHGDKAEFTYTTTLGNQRRETSEAIVQAELKAIGIKVDNGLVPANVMFGPDVLAAKNYQAMEFAWVLGSPDGQWAVDTWRCNGPSNYLSYCNKRVSALLLDSQHQLNDAKRRAEFQQADALMANDLPSVPMYSPPSILIYKKGLKGFKNTPTSAGPTWNAQDWQWTS
ncbi:MAG TPA: peptide ABC transporter substrate-binding protein [Gaiellaceae bacterium]|nr:peptide ABC transporter substrate-binding protein [Gaiellaceae bacterium]